MKIGRTIYSLTLIAFSTIFFGGCKDDNFIDEPDMTANGEVLKITASMNPVTNSRAYIQSGEVDQGTFTITYPYYYQTTDAGSNAWRHYYAYGEVSFQGTTGFAYNITNQGPVELKWAPTSSGANNGVYVRPNYETGATMFLDNVAYGTGATNGNPALKDSLISLPQTNNPYVAAMFDSITGSNDLLWGKSYANKNAQWVHFPLHHYMSRLKVNVTVDNSGDHKLTIKLDSATMKITNLLLTPKSYDRLTGTLYFIEQTNGLLKNDTVKYPADYNDFQLVYGLDQIEENPTLTGWKQITVPEEGNGDIKIFSTEDFVFPPQDLLTDENRPRLVITIPSKDVNNGIDYPDRDSVEFSGYIPRSMFIQGSGDQQLIPDRLNFLKEYVLTLNTTLTPGNPELEFMPVTVEQWVDKGHLSPKANQAGIGSAADFYKLIKTYNIYNTFQLGRYGYIMDKESGKWNFQMRATGVELELDSIQGKMIPGTMTANGATPPYQVDMRSRIEYVVLPGDDYPYEIATNSDIYDMLTTLPNQGVTSIDDDPTQNNFQTLITAWNSHEKSIQAWKQGIFGSYDYQTDKWIFKISDSITLDYDTINGAMLQDDKYKYSIVYGNNVTVTINNYPSSGASQTVEADTLTQILSGQ